jgi:aryl-alcohol dehydrogenase-like predicted oxidoreductase
VWQEIDQLVQQGKGIYVGASNFAGWHIAKAQAAASTRHFMGLVSEQSLYNLADRMIELEVIPACRDYGLGLKREGRPARLGERAETHRETSLKDRTL